MSGETILIVEDNLIIAFALQRMLIRLGYNVEKLVDSGEAALIAVIVRKPDLILMDVGLAGSLDGISAAEQIQSVASVPVIYLTGNVQNTRLAQAACLSKPVVEKELLVVMEQVLRPARGR